jgi:predicted transcriptional regulator
LLGISQVELSRRSGVPVMVLRRFEGGKTDPRTSTRDKIERALLAAGIQLVENDTVGVVVRETR